MRVKHKAGLKTLGPQAARLVTTLNEQSRPIFRLADVQRILGLSNTSARSFTRKLVERGVATRLKPGLFVLVPFDLGSATEYAGNPLLIAQEMVEGEPYYLSHATAMDIHGMLTQPSLRIYVSTFKRRRSATVAGVTYRFVRCRRKDLFGLTEHWATKQDKVRVSDLERTILDCLRQPEYAGGISEVAKGLWMRRLDIDVSLLVRYARRLGVGAVSRRLGFLLELYDIGTAHERQRLEQELTSTYATLDPVLPSAGRYIHRWRLRLNVEPDELQAVVQT